MTPIIPTPTQLTMALLGRCGKGHAERCHLLGACVDQGFSYDDCQARLDDALSVLVAQGRLERIEQPSHYAKGQSYSVWRLPSRIPMESKPMDPWLSSPAAVEPASTTAPAAGARPGTITVEQFRKMAGRKRK